MALFKRSRSPFWYMEFVFAGKRTQESTKETSKTCAREVERKRREELRNALHGIAQDNPKDRILSVAEFAKRYIERFPANHREKSTVSAKGRLKHITRLLGTKLLPDVTDACLYRYIQTRQKEHASGRTIVSV